MADFQATLPLLAILQSPAMRTRHWRQLGDLLSTVRLHHHAQTVSTCEQELV